MARLYEVTAHPKIVSYAGSWSDRDGVTYRVLARTKAGAGEHCWAGCVAPVLPQPNLVTEPLPGGDFCD